MNDIALRNLGIKTPLHEFLAYLQWSTPTADLVHLDDEELQRLYISTDQLRRHAAITLEARRETQP